MCGEEVSFSRWLLAMTTIGEGVAQNRLDGNEVITSLVDNEICYELIQNYGLMEQEGIGNCNFRKYFLPPFLIRLCFTLSIFSYTLTG